MWENLQINRLTNSNLPSKDEHTIVLLTGARQTGKTTLLLSAYPELNYFNLDAIEYREQLKQVSSFSWDKEVGNAIIDEIQKEPTLFDKIKFAFDSGKLKFSALSGSAQILLMKQTRETLAGRVMLLELFPFMLCELVNAKESKIDDPLLHKLVQASTISDVLEKQAPVLFGEHWENKILTEDYLLKWGGMPSMIHIVEPEKKSSWLRNYIATYLERDLGDLSRLNDLMPFQNFQKLAALRATNLLSYSELSRDSGIGTETARRYMEYLRISYQAFLLPPFHKNLTSRVVKTPKIFWMDNGMLRHLAGYGYEIMNGQLYENYIASEIVKYFRTTNIDSALSFYRTSSGMEVDFCIESKGKLIGLEVKFRETIDKTDFTNLRKIRDAVGTNWAGGIVVYRGNHIKKLDQSIWAVPSCRFFS